MSVELPITPKMVLTNTLELLDSPERWIKGTNAENIGGGPEPAESAAATCWCLNGAFVKVVHTLAPDVTGEIRLRIRRNTARALFPEIRDDRRAMDHLVAWNDHSERTFGEVRHLLTSTIERL